MNAPETRALPPELRQLLTRHVAPPGLKRRVAYLVAQQAQAADVPAPPHRSVPWWQQAWRPAAGLACGVLLTVLALPWLAPSHSGQDGGQPWQQQLVDDHVRSLMAAHLTDTASADWHTVQPWFVGKLDYTPPVVDVSDQGFALAGARLDWLQGRGVAALVYQRRAHAINLFVWPQAGPRMAPEPGSLRGYNLVRWRDGEMMFVAVSGLGAAELQTFAGLVAARMATRNPGR